MMISSYVICIFIVQLKTHACKINVENFLNVQIYKYWLKEYPSFVHNLTLLKSIHYGQNNGGFCAILCHWIKLSFIIKFVWTFFIDAVYFKSCKTFETNSLFISNVIHWIHHLSNFCKISGKLLGDSKDAFITLLNWPIVES